MSNNRYFTYKLYFESYNNSIFVFMKCSLIMINNPICVFDSGLGSLSIIRELRREIPHENLLYLADRSHFPYGTKQDNELRGIITNTINYLRSEEHTSELQSPYVISY